YSCASTTYTGRTSGGKLPSVLYKATSSRDTIPLSLLNIHHMGADAQAGCNDLQIVRSMQRLRSDKHSASFDSLHIDDGKEERPYVHLRGPGWRWFSAALTVLVTLLCSSVLLLRLERQQLLSNESIVSELKLQIRELKYEMVVLRRSKGLDGADPGLCDPATVKAAEQQVSNCQSDNQEAKKKLQEMVARVSQLQSERGKLVNHMQVERAARIGSLHRLSLAVFGCTHGVQDDDCTHDRSCRVHAPTSSWQPTCQYNHHGHIAMHYTYERA
ncbi:hypothetical protein HaLaN_30036, partial [Haematococcus lacustris]